MRTRIALSSLFIGSLFVLIPFTSASAPQPMHIHSATTQPRTVETHLPTMSQTWHFSKTTPTTTTTTVPAPTPVVTPAPTTTVPAQSDLGTSTSVITPATSEQVAAWEMTATCETGGDWSMQGPTYSGGLGMLNQTWVAYGGLAFASNAGLATPAQQVAIALRIQSTPPDIDGCHGSW